MRLVFFIDTYMRGAKQSPWVGESFPLRWKIYAALQDPGSQLLPKWDYFESGQKHFFFISSTAWWCFNLSSINFYKKCKLSV